MKGTQTMPDILVPISAVDMRQTEPWTYHDVVIDTGFDPTQLWHACACPDVPSHVDSCWLGWISPDWTVDAQTQVIPRVAEADETQVIEPSAINTVDVDYCWWCEGQGEEHCPRHSTVDEPLFSEE